MKTNTAALKLTLYCDSRVSYAAPVLYYWSHFAINNDLRVTDLSRDTCRLPSFAVDFIRRYYEGFVSKPTDLNRPKTIWVHHLVFNKHPYLRAAIEMYERRAY